MNQNLDELSEAELAEWQYAHREELDEEEGEAVEVDISPQFSVTMSFRLPGDEADSIREAAHEAGMNLSEWIRQACADALDPTSGRNSRHQVDVELSKALEQLDVVRERLEAARRENRPMDTTTAGTNRAARQSGGNRSGQGPGGDPAG